MLFIYHFDCSVLVGWVYFESRPKHLIEPFPISLYTRRRMNTHKSTSSTYITLQCSLLVSIKYILIGTQKNQ